MWGYNGWSTKREVVMSMGLVEGKREISLNYDKRSGRAVMSVTQELLVSSGPRSRVV